MEEVSPAWIPRVLTQAVLAVAPAALPAAAAASGAVAWPVIAGVACLASLIWLDRCTDRSVNAVDDRRLKETLAFLLQGQARRHDEVLSAIDGLSADALAGFSLGSADRERLASLVATVHRIADRPGATAEELHDGLAALSVDLKSDHAAFAAALGEVSLNVAALAEALAGVRDDVAVTARAVETQGDLTRDHIDRRADSAKREREEILEAVQRVAETLTKRSQGGADSTLVQTNAELVTLVARLSEQKDAAEDRLAAVIARQVEAERDAAGGWREALDNIKKQGAASVLAFLRETAPGPQEKAGRAEFYAELCVAAEAAADFESAEDAAQMRVAYDRKNPLALLTLGRLQQVRNDLEASLVSLRAARKLIPEANGAGRQAAAVVLTHIGLVHECAGRVAEAFQAYDEAIGVHRSGGPSARPALATALNNRGILHRERGVLDRAAADLGEARSILEKMEPVDDEALAKLLSNVASVERCRGNGLAALTLLTEARELKLNVHGPTHPDIGVMWNQFGVILCDEGRFQEALDAFEEAGKIARLAWEPSHPHVGAAMVQQATALVHLDRVGEARSRVERAHSILVRGLGNAHPIVAAAMAAMAFVAHAEGEHELEREWLKKAFAIRLEKLGCRSAHTISTANNLASAGVDPVEEVRRLAGDAAAATLADAMVGS